MFFATFWPASHAEKNVNTQMTSSYFMVMLRQNTREIWGCCDNETMLELHPSFNQSKVAATFRGKIHFKQHFLPDKRSSGDFSSKMCKFLRSLADLLSALAFLCWHYTFNSYVTFLTLSFNTVYEHFHSH